MLCKKNEQETPTKRFDFSLAIWGRNMALDICYEFEF
jgi:hypothetical protein